MLRPMTRSPKSADSDVCSRVYQIRIRSTSIPLSTQLLEQKEPLKDTRLASPGSLHCTNTLAMLLLSLTRMTRSFHGRPAFWNSRRQISVGQAEKMMNLLRGTLYHLGSGLFTRFMGPPEALTPTTSTPMLLRISRSALLVVRRLRSPSDPTGQDVKLEQNDMKRKSNSPSKRCYKRSNSSSRSPGGGSHCRMHAQVQQHPLIHRSSTEYEPTPTVRHPYIHHWSQSMLITGGSSCSNTPLEPNGLLSTPPRHYHLLRSLQKRAWTGCWKPI